MPTWYFITGVSPRSVLEDAAAGRRTTKGRRHQRLFFSMQSAQDYTRLLESEGWIALRIGSQERAKVAPQMASPLAPMPKPKKAETWKPNYIWAVLGFSKERLEDEHARCHVNGIKFDADKYMYTHVVEPLCAPFATEEEAMEFMAKCRAEGCKLVRVERRRAYL